MRAAPATTGRTAHSGPATKNSTTASATAGTPSTAAASPRRTVASRGETGSQCVSGGSNASWGTRASLGVATCTAGESIRPVPQELVVGVGLTSPAGGARPRDVGHPAYADVVLPIGQHHPSA